MALGGNYGNSAGTASSKFRAYIEIGISDQTATQYRLRHKFSIRVDTGNFNGVTAHKSWGGTVRLYGAGWYGDSGWIDDGWKSSGQGVSLSCNAYYTGGSGRTYRSSCSASYTVPQLQQIPNLPTSISINEAGTATWAFTTASNKPVTDQQIALEINDEWQSAIAISNGTTKSYSFGELEDNSRYRARVRLHNSSGWTDYKTSEYLYTTPLSPTCSGQRIDNTAYLSVTNGASINYVDSYEWKINSNGTWEDLDPTTEENTQIQLSNYGETIQAQCRVKNLDSQYSDWVTFEVEPLARLFVRLPDNIEVIEPVSGYNRIKEISWTPTNGTKQVLPFHYSADYTYAILDSSISFNKTGGILRVDYYIYSYTNNALKIEILDGATTNPIGCSIYQEFEGDSLGSSEHSSSFSVNSGLQTTTYESNLVADLGLKEGSETACIWDFSSTGEGRECVISQLQIQGTLASSKMPDIQVFIQDPNS